MKNIIIIGNKIDLQREVESDELIDFCKEHKLISCEASAKGDLNIKDSIRKLVAKIMNIDLDGNPIPEIIEKVEEPPKIERLYSNTAPSQENINKKNTSELGTPEVMTKSETPRMNKKHEDGCKCSIF